MKTNITNFFLTIGLFAILSQTSPLLAAPKLTAIEVCSTQIEAEVRKKVVDGMPVPAAEALLQQLLLGKCLSGPEPALDESLATFLGALGAEYHRLALMFVSKTLDSSAYLGLLRDRNAKRRLAQKSTKYSVLYMKGDEDGDFVPDQLDNCPATPLTTVTTVLGCPDPKHSRPDAPSDRGVRLLLSNMKLALDRGCDEPLIPAIPEPIKLGYPNSRLNGTLMNTCLLLGKNDLGMLIAVRPVNRVQTSCPIYYEINAVMHTVNAGKNIDVGTNIVFKDSEALPWNTASRAVFHIPGNTLNGQRQRLINSYLDAKHGTQWRVRAVSGSGLAGSWSAFVSSNELCFGK